MRCTGTLRVERSLLEKTLLPDLPCLPRALPKAASAWLARRLAAVAVLGSAFALAPGPTLAQWERGASYAGVWSVRFTDPFGHRQSCSIELSAAGSIMGTYRASPRGCGSALFAVSRWQPWRGGISLDDISGQPLIALRAGWDGLSGKDEAGKPIRLVAASAQRGSGFEPSFDRRASPAWGCSVYYGQSERCAEARDIAAPRLAPGQSAMVRIVYPANLRQFPSLGARSLALIPVNTCVAADACARQEDGAEWCRISHAGRTGYVVKLFARDGRRQILYSNQCAP